jgi:hypothetical protein
MIKVLVVAVAVVWYSAAGAQTPTPSPRNAPEPPNSAVAPAPAAPAPADTSEEDMWVHRGARRGWVMEREFASAPECRAFAKRYAAENNVPVGCAPHRGAPVRPEEKKPKP